jgi:hypothetical protein
MKNRAKLSAVTLVALTVAACSFTENNKNTLVSNAASTPNAQVETKPLPSPTSPIRSVDFANLSYPDYPDYSSDRSRRITLKAGEGAPDYINYGDVTGDGVEDAMLVLGIETRGSAIPHIVYIYTLENNRPKLLWHFETGDRADGGLRQVYSENGELVVELFGRDKIIGRNLYADDGTRSETPYPYIITRTCYQWRGNHFQQKGKAEELSDSSGYGSPNIPEYKPNG